MEYFLTVSLATATKLVILRTNFGALSNRQMVIGSCQRAELVRVKEISDAYESFAGLSTLKFRAKSRQIKRLGHHNSRLRASRAAAVERSPRLHTCIVGTREV